MTQLAIDAIQEAIATGVVLGVFLWLASLVDF